MILKFRRAEKIQNFEAFLFAHFTYVIYDNLVVTMRNAKFSREFFSYNNLDNAVLGIDHASRARCALEQKQRARKKPRISLDRHK